MSDDYSDYLLAIVLIIAAVTACLALFFRRGRKRAAAPPAPAAVPVTHGSVSVFFDRAGNATVIPYVKDRFGKGKATAGVIFLKRPYSASKLGSAIKASMDGCRGAEPCPDKELLERLESGDWSVFAADKRNISIYYKENYGIVFNTTRRKAEGVYEFNCSGPEMNLPADTGDKVLGDTALSLLRRCS